MDDRCEPCDELWRAYAKATTEHVRALKEQEAIAAESVPRFREMEPMIEIAAGTRERARIAIKRHLAKDHGEQPRAKASGRSG
jgi:hypothetical protein